MGNNVVSNTSDSVHFRDIIRRVTNKRQDLDDSEPFSDIDEDVRRQLQDLCPTLKGLGFIFCGPDLQVSTNVYNI